MNARPFIEIKTENLAERKIRISIAAQHVKIESSENFEDTKCVPLSLVCS